MFPSPAIFEFEMEFTSQAVYQKLGKLNQIKKFFTTTNPKDLDEFAAFLPSQGIPNEVNDEECAIDEFLGYE